MARIYEVDAQWDSEAKVWVAESNDIPGLITEAPSLDMLGEKIRGLAPVLFELNGGLEPGQKEINFHLHAHHDQTASVGVIR